MTYCRNGALLYTSGRPRPTPPRGHLALLAGRRRRGRRPLRNARGRRATRRPSPSPGRTLVGATAPGNDPDQDRRRRVGQRRRVLDEGLAVRRRRLRRVHRCPPAPATPCSASSNGDTDQGYADIDYAFYTYPGTGQLMVFEKGVYRGPFGAYAAGDTLRVSVESGVVKYWRNGRAPLHERPGPDVPAARGHLALLHRRGRAGRHSRRDPRRRRHRAAHRAGRLAERRRVSPRRAPRSRRRPRPRGATPAPPPPAASPSGRRLRRVHRPRRAPATPCSA